MEWVEVTGRTVEDAKEAALDELGVDEAEAEFEVLEEPRPGLFGRLRSEARVRARVAPTAPRPKVDRRDRRRGPRGVGAGGGRGDSAGEGAGRGAGDREGPPPRAVGRSVEARSGAEGASGGDSGGDRAGARIGESAGERTAGPRRSRGGRRGRGDQSSGGPAGAVEGRRVHDDQDDDVDRGREGMADDRGDEGEGNEVEVAEEFVSGLLQTFGGSFTIERRPLEDDLVELSVQGDGLGLLIGPRGQTLAAVQELARTVVQRRSRGRAGRILVDVAGYRQARRVALERFAGEVATQVRSSGVPRVLEAMPPADRKVVHDAINAIDGVTTTSEGEEPNRRVVISPQADVG